MAAARPRLTPLTQAGKWPAHTRGTAYYVKVVGNRAYVTLGSGGLVILDVSDPAYPARLGGYDPDAQALRVAVSGSVAYVADDYYGLQIIDVSNPSSPVRLGARKYRGQRYACYEQADGAKPVPAR